MRSTHLLRTCTPGCTCTDQLLLGQVAVRQAWTRPGALQVQTLKMARAQSGPEPFHGVGSL